MKATIYAVLNLCVLLSLFALMVKDLKLAGGLGSKTYHLLLLGWLKLDLGIAHVIENIRLATEKAFKGYRYSAVAAGNVRRKEQQLTDYRQQLKEMSEGYKRKERYNRKIPG